MFLEEPLGGLSVRDIFGWCLPGVACLVSLALRFPKGRSCSTKGATLPGLEREKAWLTWTCDWRLAIGAHRHGQRYVDLGQKEVAAFSVSLEKFYAKGAGLSHKTKQCGPPNRPNWQYLQAADSSLVGCSTSNRSCVFRQQTAGHIRTRPIGTITKTQKLKCVLGRDKMNRSCPAQRRKDETIIVHANCLTEDDVLTRYVRLGQQERKGRRMLSPKLTSPIGLWVQALPPLPL